MKKAEQVKKFIGAHVSISGGIQNSPIYAKDIGANAFAIFTKNQRQWKSKALDNEAISAFQKNLQLVGIQPAMVLVHDSYLINLGHPDEEKRQKSLEAFIDEIERVDQLGLKLLNFHPGSSLKEISEEECIDNIAECMNVAIEKTKNVILVLETTAGQGSNIGYKFEHFKEIIKKIKNKKRVGVCIDTCHIYSAGYDIAQNKESFNAVMDDFDRVVGFKYLRGMHLNDSKVALKSRVDRHEVLGKGTIGEGAFQWLMADPRFNDIPLILETPDDLLWPQEIKMLRHFER